MLRGSFAVPGRSARSATAPQAKLLALVFFSCDLVVLRWSVIGACPREGVWRGGGSACPQGTGLGGGETGAGLDLDERFQRNFKSLQEILVVFQKKTKKKF
jgi:hypothetical protein